MPHQIYRDPFSQRWTSKEMLQIFSEDEKFRTWRKLWVELARAQQKLGLNIADEQINQLEEQKNNIDYDVVAQLEKQVRHDVMAHIKAYGKACPDAAGIIHLGATSCYVGDNADVILIRKGLSLLRRKLLTVIGNLAEFAKKYKSMPTLAYTHLQPAQPTTVGKRACLWLYDFLNDYKEMNLRENTLKMRGVKGASGSQASFLELFDGDHQKVKDLERLVVNAFNFNAAEPVTGQTYTRKNDYYILSCLSGLAQSASKFAADLRLLQSMKEIEEPFESSQVGSSAMPYKRNPMRSERINGIARHLISLTQDAANTAATQWFERTLDDSSNRRIFIPQSFLAADAILELCANITAGLVVYPKVIEKNLLAELPFMATENILMIAVKAGGNRQILHERLRVHAMAAGKKVKEEGASNDLIERIENDKLFNITKEELYSCLDPIKYIGRSPEQVDEFLACHVNVVVGGLHAASAGELRV